MPANPLIPTKTPTAIPAAARPERPLGPDDDDEEGAGLDVEVADGEKDGEDGEDGEDPVTDVVEEEEVADAFNSTISVEKAVGVMVGMEVPIADDASTLYSFSRAAEGETPAFGFANSLMQTFI